MPSFTPMTLFAVTCAGLAAPLIQSAVSSEEIATTTAPAAPTAPSAEHTTRPPSDGGYPVDAMYNFGSIHDLFAQRRHF